LQNVVSRRANLSCELDEPPPLRPLPVCCHESDHCILQYSLNMKGGEEVKRYTLGMCAMLLAFMLGPPGELRADSSTVSMTLTGVSLSLGDYYTAPYQISVGGGQSYPLVCDDAYDEINFGETWNATTETFSNLSGALFYSEYGQIGYEEAGWLVSQIFNSLDEPAGAGNLAAEEFQYALWDLFDPSFSNAGVPAGDEEQITTDLQNAENPFYYDTTAALNYDANLVIYTPSPPTGPGKGEAQEFFGVGTPQAVSMSEPTTLWSLLIVLAAIALACKWMDKTTVKSSASAGV